MGIGVSSDRNKLFRQAALSLAHRRRLRQLQRHSFPLHSTQLFWSTFHCYQHQFPSRHSRHLMLLHRVGPSLCRWLLY